MNKLYFSYFKEGILEHFEKIYINFKLYDAL